MFTVQLRGNKLKQKESCSNKRRYFFTQQVVQKRNFPLQDGKCARVGMDSNANDCEIKRRCYGMFPKAGGLVWKSIIRCLPRCSSCPKASAISHSSPTKGGRTGRILISPTHLHAKGIRQALTHFHICFPLPLGQCFSTVGIKSNVYFISLYSRFLKYFRSHPHS